MAQDEERLTNVIREARGLCEDGESASALDVAQTALLIGRLTPDLPRKFRDECLVMDWFRDRIGAKIVIDGWRAQYNNVRPHSSLQYITPTEFRRRGEIVSTAGTNVV